VRTLRNTRKKSRKAQKKTKGNIKMERKGLGDKRGDKTKYFQVTSQWCSDLA